MKRLIHLTLYIAFILLLKSCSDEEIVQLQQIDTETEIPLESFTANQLPSLVSMLNSSSEKAKLSWSSKSGSKEVALDESRILMVKDSIGNETYSIRMHIPEKPYNVFYNVVAKKTSEGSFNEPMILRYEIEKDYLETYHSSNRNDARFKGIIKVYSFNTFFDGGTIFGKTIDEPCIEAHADGGSSGSSGGGGNGGGTYDSVGTGHDPGSSYSYYYVYYAPEWGGGPGAGTVEIGEGDFGDFGTDGEWKRNVSGKNDDCPDDELIFPINEEEDDVLLIPSCQSFEYANGNLVKAAGVSNIQNHFIAAGVDKNGSPYAAHIHLNITKSYFSMPKSWTNGNAANATANALLIANNKTKAWFLLNPKVKGSVLANEWEKNIRTAMRAIGGDWSRNPPFSIPNLAPYAEDWVWDKTDCTK